MSTADSKKIEALCPEGAQWERVDFTTSGVRKLRRHRTSTLSVFSVLIAVGLILVVVPGVQQHLPGWTLLLSVGPFIPFVLIGASDRFLRRACWTSETFLLAPPPVALVLAVLLLFVGPAASGMLLVWSISNHPELSGTGFGRRGFAVGLLQLLGGGGMSLILLFQAVQRPALKVDRNGIAFRSGGAPIPWALMESLRLDVNPPLTFTYLKVVERGSRRRFEGLVPGPDTAARRALEAVLRRYWPQAF